jgi:hypothetical protein
MMFDRSGFESSSFAGPETTASIFADFDLGAFKE